MAMAMVMAMDMAIITNMKMIDIHNHLLYGVDDGSKNIEMTEKLFQEYKKQNINKIFLTPHVNSVSTKTTRQKQIENFKSLEKLANKYNLEIFLGAEIYIPFKLPDIDFSKYLMGSSNVLLVEFSTFNSSPIYDHVYELISYGYKIIIAHVERYNYLTLEDIIDLRELGAMIQVNARSVIKKEKSSYYKKAISLLKKDVVDFVATDCHNLTNRGPKLKQAYEDLKRIVGITESNRLVKENQIKLFFD